MLHPDHWYLWSLMDQEVSLYYLLNIILAYLFLLLRLNLYSIHLIFVLHVHVDYFYCLGSYEQSPRFMEAYGDPLDSENAGVGSGENQLREDLAEAMLETSIAPHRAPGK